MATMATMAAKDSAGPESLIIDTDSSKPEPLVIDTDCGIDDAQAIILAAAHPDKFNIVGLTTVEGNTSEENVFQNVKFISKILGKTFPIFRGSNQKKEEAEKKEEEAEKKEEEAEKKEEEVSPHGFDGLGDMKLRKQYLVEEKEEETQAGKLSASEAICHLALVHGGSLNLVCIGPLTNLSKALSQDPHLGAKLKSCTIMGGNSTSLGNKVKSDAE